MITKQQAEDLTALINEALDAFTVKRTVKEWDAMTEKEQEAFAKQTLLKTSAILGVAYRFTFVLLRKKRE